MILKKDKISINMVKNSLNKEEDQMEVEAVANNSISNLLISEMLMIFSENFSEVKIHLPTSLMKMMISLVEEVSDMDLVEE